MAPAAVAEDVPNPSEKASNFQNIDLRLDEPMETKTEEKVCNQTEEDQPDIVHETIQIVQEEVPVQGSVEVENEVTRDQKEERQVESDLQIADEGAREMPVPEREEEGDQDNIVSGQGQTKVPDLKVEESEDSEEINQKLLEQDSDFSDEADEAV